MKNKMENKSEQVQKTLLDERKRDRGDDFKKQDGIKGKINEVSNLKFSRKPPLPNQGDVPVINKISKITKAAININNIDKVNNDKSKNLNENKVNKITANISSKVNTASEKEQMLLNKTPEIKSGAVKTKGEERHVNNKVNSRHKAFNQNLSKEGNKKTINSDLQNDGLRTHTSLKAGSTEILSGSIKPESTKTDPDVVKKGKDSIMHRKPMIKTVKSKYDNRIYKAVTFTEPKRHKPTILEINIPNIQAKKGKIKLMDKNLEAKPETEHLTNNKSTSKVNTRFNTQHNRKHTFTEPIKRKKLNRCISSPDKFKKVESPPTEVAKWAPSCLNAHTKPYYEAWVNTTLAAISKISKKDKLFLEKENIIKTFQKSLELGTQSPELVHEQFADECYTGKIKIKHKHASKRTRQPVITPLIDTDKEVNHLKK